MITLKYLLEPVDGYVLIFSSLIVLLLICFVIFVIYFYKTLFNIDKEKASVYECGFNSFGDTRTKFEVKFYRMGILFIVFDLEVCFFFPWALALDHISFSGTICMIVFAILLTVVFFMSEKKEL